MPNRMLKESICTSCEIDRLSLEGERFFYRLIVQVDDFGRTDARLPILRSKCFPLKVDQVKDKDIEKWLKELVNIGLVCIYCVDNKPYLYFVNWDKHQQKRAKHSKYPAPDDGLISDDVICNQAITNSSEKRETRNEKRETADVLFEKLWKEYPRKMGKGQVSDSKKLELYKIGEDVMFKCLKRFKKQMENENRPIEKYQYGSTFFNSGYIDYLDENYSPNNESTEKVFPEHNRRF